VLEPVEGLQCDVGGAVGRQISVDGGAPGWEVVRDDNKIIIDGDVRGGGLSESIAATNFTCRRISVRSRKMDA
jgi:hypothetical protein